MLDSANVVMQLSDMAINTVAETAMYSGITSIVGNIIVMIFSAILVYYSYKYHKSKGGGYVYDIYPFVVVSFGVGIVGFVMSFMFMFYMWDYIALFNPRVWAIHKILLSLN